ncbi:MAG: MFS transporter [Chloroflexi bacterium]|nr:MAG: MFS transporter [Chloroflexota bacterium]
MTLAFLAAGLLLAMAPWFSASAVAPLLRDEWHASGLGLTLLTVAVQVGFALGALALAISGATDVLPSPVMFVAGAWTAAVATAAFALVARDPVSGILLRLATGAALAAVYPPALKIVAGWFRRDRGLAIGVVIGALTVGSALPHLLRAVGALAAADWREIVLMAALAAASGPLEARANRFSWRLAATALREPSVRLANLGYLGHMWELYARWTWVPTFLVASFAAAGLTDPGTASLGAFAVVAVGGAGCVVAGALADRLGRTTLTIVAMAASGSSAVAIGFLFGGPPAAVVALGLVWGLTVVADSAQFSAAISELAPAGTAGSALSLQLAIGFLLTVVTILGVGALSPTDGIGWRVAFAALALGPMVGIVAMARLRLRPEATRMASGHR